METTTQTTSAHDVIATEVSSWPGVQAAPGRRGEFSFKVGKREIGHLHGSRAAHFGFPKDIGAALREEGRIGPHPVAPDHTGWGARQTETDEDIEDVIALMRQNYDRVVARHGVPGSG